MEGNPRGPGASGVVDDVTDLVVRARQALDDGDLVDARRRFDDAYRAAERDGDGAAMAEAAIGQAGIWVQEHRTAAADGLLRARLHDALDRVPADSTLALRLRARIAGETDYRAGTHAAILKVLDEATGVGDPVARVEALSLAHHSVLGPDHGTLRRELADEMMVEAARTGRRGDVLMALLWQTVDLFLAGDPRTGRRLAELRATLAERPHRAIGYVVEAIAATLALRDGRFEEAERRAATARDLGLAAGDEDATAWYGGQLVAIRWFQGRLPELLPMLADLAQSPTLSASDNSFFAALAIASAAAGDRRAAAGALAALGCRDLDELPRTSTWLVTMYGVVEATHLLGDECFARRAYELLRPFAGLPMVASLGVACFGSVHHALAVASLTVGETERAINHLREAVDANLALGHWPATARSRSLLADVLDQRGGPGDAAEAAGHRARAADGTGDDRPASGVAACVRHGRGWRVRIGDRTVTVEHSVGMLHLAVLTANPGTEIAALDLVAGVGALASALPRVASTQPVLDRAAVHGYRQRLAELDDEIDRLGDRASRARDEREWLVGELSAGAGLGGRSRSFADEGERARLAVGKSIRRAIGNIAAVDAAIGAHLRAAVHTGLRCSYRPV